MTFVNTHLLPWLLLGLIPIIIYYLMRFRCLRIDWGANYVLERALERLRKKLYLKQLVLLALRVLALLAIVLAFARPVSSKVRSYVSGTGRHRVLIVDGSYSMLAGPPGQTDWQRAQGMMKTLVSSWGRGERWSLYFVDNLPRWVVDDEAVATPEASSAVIDGLAPTESSASLARALEETFKRIGGRETEIYIVADDQAETWRGVDELELEPDSAPSVYWLRPPRNDTSNLAVTRVAVGQERVLRGHPSRVFVRVRNYAEDPRQDLELDILVDGVFFSRRRLSLLPGQDAWTHADVTFDTPGSHAVTARLGGDALRYDDRMSAGVEVIDGLAVAVLRDAGRDDKFSSAWGFLKLAGDVLTRRDMEDAPLFRGAAFNVSLVEGEADAERLGAFDVVVVDGGRTVTPDLADALSRYVALGGGLVLAADDGVDAGTWNDVLGGAGLMPGTLGRLNAEPLGGEQYQSPARTGLGEGLRAFETTEDGDITRLRFYSWFDIENAGGRDAVLASFSDGSPFALRRRSDPGCTLLLAAGLNCRNNNALVREMAYPLVIRLLAEAGSGRIHPRTVAVNEPIRLGVDGREPPTGAQFVMEGLEPAALSASADGQRVTLSLPGGINRTGLGSVLVIREDGHERAWYGIQGERVDSDLTPIEEGLRAALAERLGLTEAGSWEELDAILQATRRGTEWHHWIVLAALACLFGEMLIARTFV